ncbi:MAG: hypothetical protein MJK12_08860 [Colwellia sp.]|nr:hypothetical protein [Colwellia sp.]
MKNKTLTIALLLLNFNSYAVEHQFKGLIDLRLYSVDVIDKSESYLAGNYGKYGFDQGSGISLAQLGLQYHGNWDNGLSATIVVNGYAGGIENSDNEAIGLTEAYLSYKSLPNQNGWRYKVKGGVFYPQISMENIATAWSTPYTLTSSSLNTWIGEEMRSTGLEFTLDKLGKFSKSDHDFSLDVSFFQNNDTLGAMLAWHGWTMGSRQTLIHEKLIVQPFFARQGDLKDQAALSDPFIELDSKFGGHIVGRWQYKNTAKFNIGYYDNNANADVVENGQYTWPTKFTHLGLKVKLAKKIELISQYMQGNTYMQSPYGNKVVDTDFKNGFMMLRKYWGDHHIAIRFEKFSVDDLDQTVGDNNNESGEAFTLSYRYRLNKHSFIQTEYNYLDSTRASRYYLWQPISLVEQQVQLAFRYYL